MSIVLEFLLMLCVQPGRDTEDAMVNNNAVRHYVSQFVHSSLCLCVICECVCERMCANVEFIQVGL